MKHDRELGGGIKSLHIFLLTEESETIDGPSKQMIASQSLYYIKQLLY